MTKDLTVSLDIFLTDHPFLLSGEGSSYPKL